MLSELTNVRRHQKKDPDACWISAGAMNQHRPGAFRGWCGSSTPLEGARHIRQSREERLIPASAEGHSARNRPTRSDLSHPLFKERLIYEQPTARTGRRRELYVNRRKSNHAAGRANHWKLNSCADAPSECRSARSWPP